MTCSCHRPNLVLCILRKTVVPSSCVWMCIAECSGPHTHAVVAWEGVGAARTSVYNGVCSAPCTHVWRLTAWPRSTGPDKG